MITCCANPACSTSRRSGACGELIAVNRPSGMEFFWLCSPCARHYELSCNLHGQICICPRQTASRMHDQAPATIPPGAVIHDTCHKPIPLAC